jgi:hypothetical protein
MGKPDRTPDPLQRDLDEAWAKYQLLAAKVPPGQGEGGRRPPPASRPPLSIDPVSLMAELEQFIGAWIGQARYALDPWQRIDLTARTKAVCPYCTGTLICWLRPQNEGASYITCVTGHVDSLGPTHWVRADWPRLGVMTGIHIDAPTPAGSGRWGARLHVVED